MSTQEYINLLNGLKSANSEKVLLNNNQISYFTSLIAANTSANQTYTLNIGDLEANNAQLLADEILINSLIATFGGQ